ncbi:MAG: LysR family transcriptional regulator, partial [Porticoccaceae bacterium]
MDIKALKLFQHLANSLHFGKTATAHHLSPSTLSRSIQRLEEELGSQL